MTVNRGWAEPDCGGLKYSGRKLTVLGMNLGAVTK